MVISPAVKSTGYIWRSAASELFPVLMWTNTFGQSWASGGAPSEVGTGLGVAAGSDLGALGLGGACLGAGVGFSLVIGAAVAATVSRTAMVSRVSWGQP